MAYFFYLDGVLLPITPGELQMKIKGQNATETLMDETEINYLKAPGLTEIEFECRLPQTPYTFINGEALPAADYLALFESMKTEKRVFQFIVSRMDGQGNLLFDTNIKAALEEYEITESADEGFDILVNVSLKQYREFGTKLVKIEEPASPGEPAKAVTETPRESTTAPGRSTYTVQSGDCLWNIAKKYLGNGARYKEIYTLNKDKIQNPNLIYPGQVLTLPAA